MAITSYCKKCRQDVPRGDSCPYCGAKLTKSSARVVWCLEHSPVKDWMCWNAVLRIMAPAMVVLLGMILLLEGLAGGWTAVEALVNRGLLWTWGTLCLAMLAGLWLILLGQGRDLLDCVVDGLWCICEETFWGISAHNGSSHAGQTPAEQRPLPEKKNPYIDLFAAQTACTLAHDGKRTG